MKKILFLVFCFTFFSCIPVKVAPKIETYDVVLAKKFKRYLPKRYAYVFEDYKDANEFYYYIKTLYQLNDNDLAVPFTIEGKEFHFSFYEVERETETINTIPVIIDGALQHKGADPILQDAHTSRNGYWYIAIMVTDENLKDGLHPDYEYKSEIIKYLDNVRETYFISDDYEKALLRKQFMGN